MRVALPVLPRFLSWLVALLLLLSMKGFAQTTETVIPGNLRVQGQTKLNALNGGRILRLDTLQRIQANPPLNMNGFVYPDATGSFSSTAWAGNGQLLIGNASGAPALGSLLGTTNELEVTAGPGTLQVGIPNSFTMPAASPAFTAVSVAADPTEPLQLTTKQYVDAVAAGLKFKEAVATATTGNITLSGEQTIDGVLTSTSRVLVKNQSTASQNGIYVSAAGAWARASDMNEASEIPGALTFVSGGTTHGGEQWVVSTPSPITLGSTSIAWSLFYSSEDVTVTSPLVKTGSDIALTRSNLTGTANQVNLSASGTGVLAGSTNIQLSLPQDIATTSDVTFDDITVGDITASGPANITGLISATNGVQVLNTFNAFQSVGFPYIYGTGSSGSAPFNAQGNMVLAARGDTDRDIIFQGRVSAAAVQAGRVVGGSGALEWSYPINAQSSVNVTGLQSNSQAIAFTGNGTAGDGRIFRDAAGGLVYRGVTGTNYDFIIEGAAGNDLIRNPTATTALQFPGASGITVTGPATLSGGALFDVSQSSAQGKIYYSSSDGLTIRGRAGSGNDFILYSADAGSLILNPTGTRNLTIGNSGGTVTITPAVTASALAGSGTRMVVASSTGALSTQTIPTGVSPANPTASAGLTAVNGSATTYMRSDAAPAISQAIVPTWTGRHTFSGSARVPSGDSLYVGAANTEGSIFWGGLESFRIENNATGEYPTIAFGSTSSTWADISATTARFNTGQFTGLEIIDNDRTIGPDGIDLNIEQNHTLGKITLGGVGNEWLTVADGAAYPYDGINAWKPLTAYQGFRYGGSSASSDVTLPATATRVYASASVAPFTITLPPSVAANSGQVIHIFKNDQSRNCVTVDGNGSETIGNQASVQLCGNRLRSRLVIIASAGGATNWDIVEHYDEGTFVLTLQGGSTAPTGTMNYVQDGNTVSVTFPTFMYATSDSLGLALSGFPSHILPNGAVHIPSCNVVDNGTHYYNAVVTSLDGCVISSGTSWVSCYRNGTSLGFTASGDKGFGSNDSAIPCRATYNMQ